MQVVVVSSILLGLTMPPPSHSIYLVCLLSLLSPLFLTFILLGSHFSPEAAGSSTCHAIDVQAYTYFYPK
jgi:hypothetical protein